MIQRKGNIFTSLIFESLDQLGHQCFMGGNLAGYANDMYIVFHRHFGDFFGCLKQGANIHIKSEIRKPGGDDFDAAIVTVLSHFCNQYSGVLL